MGENIVETKFSTLMKKIPQICVVKNIIMKRSGEGYSFKSKIYTHAIRIECMKNLKSVTIGFTFTGKICFHMKNQMNAIKWEINKRQGERKGA